MYFNKTHCSMTFDLFLVDLKLLTPLTPASDSGGHRSCTLPGVRKTKMEIYLHFDACEDSAFSVKGLTDLFNVLIYHSLSIFSLSLLSIHKRQEKKTHKKKQQPLNPLTSCSVSRRII